MISMRFRRKVTTATWNTRFARMENLWMKYHVPVQSHLSEGLDEVEWVKQLEPGLSCYGEAYDRFQLFGNPEPAVMAHCVFPNEKEIELLRERNVTVAHCPECNMFAANIAPIKTYL